MFAGRRSGWRDIGRQPVRATATWLEKFLIVTSLAAVVLQLSEHVSRSISR
jgi:hypothetical protein